LDLHAERRLRNKTSFCSPCEMAVVVYGNDVFELGNSHILLGFRER
jgi:hypothetical protein